MIYYRLTFPKLASHYIDVQLNINSPLAAGQKFRLPNWIPGSYMIRDFSKNLSSVAASCKQQTVRLKKCNKSEWELLEDVDCLQLNYQVYAWDLSVRSAHADLNHVFFNGSSLFLSILGKEGEEHHLKVSRQALLEEHPHTSRWTLATTLPKVDVDEQGFGHYKAENYESLIDHPVEIADLRSIEFDVAGVRHRMVFTEAPENIDLKRIARDVKTICETEIRFWGDEKPPFDEYLFMTLSLPKGFGGLEHRSSTALHCSHKDLPLCSDEADNQSEEYRQFLSLCAHEYFHSWNVKRLKPAEFVPMHLEQEVYTEMLWFFEGITSYYDELFLPRAGVITIEAYLDLLAKNITRVEQGQGQFRQTLAESSFDAWTKFYKQDENAPNAIVSYYTKGALAALRLDFEIRQQTQSRYALDDLMRHLWRQYGKSAIGISESNVLQACKECFGLDLSELFARLYHSTQKIDLTPVFDAWGVEARYLSNQQALEKGGVVKSFNRSEKPIPSMGIKWQMQDGLLRVTQVHENSTAAALGLSAGDDLIAINNQDIRGEDLDKWIAKLAVGETITASYFRRGRLHQGKAKLKISPVCYCNLSLNGEPNEYLKKWVLSNH